MRPPFRQKFELCVLALLACAGVGLALLRNETAFAAVFAAQATFAVGIAIGYRGEIIHKRGFCPFGLIANYYPSWNLEGAFCAGAGSAVTHLIHSEKPSRAVFVIGELPAEMRTHFSEQLRVAPQQTSLAMLPFSLAFD